MAGTAATENIAAWDGVNWQALGSGLPGNPVYAVTTYKGDLIAGGVIFGGAARWNGSQWMAINAGPQVLCLTEYNGELIAAGCSGAINAWNGTHWRQLGGTVNGCVRALTSFNGDLFAAGNFTSIGGSPFTHVARWDGSMWQTVGAGLVGSCYCLTVANQQLIAGGDVLTSGFPFNRVAAWNGTAWQPVLPGIVNDTVRCLLSFNGWLVGGGYFFSLSQPVQSAGFVAYFDGASWQPLGPGVAGGVDTFVRAFSIYRGDLVVGGSFALAGGLPSSNIARYGSLSPALTQQPADQSACPHQPITFTVTANGTGNTSYQWRKRGINLVDGPQINGSTTPTLTLTFRGIIDRGPYDCVITDECSSSTSNSVRILPCVGSTGPQ